MESNLRREFCKLDVPCCIFIGGCCTATYERVGSEWWTCVFASLHITSEAGGMCVFSVNSRHLSWKNTLTTKRCMLPTAPGMQHRRGSVCKTMETLHLSRRLLALAAVKSPTASQLERGMIPANTPLIHTTVGRYSAAFISPQKKNKTSNFTRKHNLSSLCFVTGLEWGSVSFSLARRSITPSASITYVLLLTCQNRKGKNKTLPFWLFHDMQRLEWCSASFPEKPWRFSTRPSDSGALAASCSPSQSTFPANQQLHSLWFN